MTSKTPDALEKKDLLYGKAFDEEKLNDCAEGFLADNRLCEALEFFQVAKNTSGIEKILQKALQSGDLFLLQQSCRALGRKPSDDELQKVKQSAAAAGKSRHAENADKLLRGESLDDNDEEPETD